VSALAPFPRPSAMASARSLAKRTVNHKPKRDLQSRKPKLSRRGLKRVPCQLNRRQYCAYFHDETSPGFLTIVRGSSLRNESTTARERMALSASDFFPYLSDRVHGHLRKPFLRSSAGVRESAPRLRAGKKCEERRRSEWWRPSKPANRPPVTGKVPADSGTIFFLSQAPGDGEHWNDHKEPAEELRQPPSSCCTTWCFALIPPNAEPLFPVDRKRMYRAPETVRAGPGLVMPASCRMAGPLRWRKKIRIVHVRMRTASMAIFTSYTSIFLPR